MINADQNGNILVSVNFLDDFTSTGVPSGQRVGQRAGSDVDREGDAEGLGEADEGGEGRDVVGRFEAGDGGSGHRLRMHEKYLSSGCMTGRTEALKSSGRMRA